LPSGRRRHSVRTRASPACHPRDLVPARAQARTRGAPDLTLTLRVDTMEPGALIHGWPGLLGAYATVQGSLLAGMVRARAPWGRVLRAPVIAAPLTVASGVGVALLTPALASLG